MIAGWGSFTFRDGIPSRRSRIFAEIRNLYAWDDRHVQGQPRTLLMRGLVQCRAGPDWVEPCHLGS